VLRKESQVIYGG